VENAFANDPRTKDVPAVLERVAGAEPDRPTLFLPGCACE